MFSRGIAAFFGGFAILNCLGNFLAPGFDANIWWIDFAPLPRLIAGPALLLGAVALLIHAIRPARGLAMRIAVFIPIALLALVSLADAARFYLLLHRHSFITTVPFPFSALVCAAMTWIAWRVLKPSSLAVAAGRARLWAIGTFAMALLVFPFAQMYFFGNTNYERHADVIVVFGARAHADGTPSGVLADRVQTACRLYHHQRAAQIIFSGGPGDGAIDEPQCMRALALKSGIPDSAILLDHEGLNTDATVRNTTTLFRASHTTRVLAVSHSYHLPRIKMSYRQAGWEVYTVPAKEYSRLPGGGRFLRVREIFALWAYYLHPLRK